MSADEEGVSYYTFNWFVLRMPFVILFFFILYAFVASQLSVNVNTFDVEADIYSTRIISSPNGIVYVDKHFQRPYPGVIDASRFSDGNIDAIFDASEKEFSAKLNLKYNGVEKERFANKKYYERWKPYTGFIKKYDSDVRWFYVMVEDNGQRYPGRLRIEMVVPHG